MSIVAVPSERIRELYRAFREEGPYKKWRASYLASLERIQSLDAKTLETPEVQRELWSLRELATLGSGDGVNVQGAWTDPEIVGRVVALRAVGRVADPTARAKRIREAFDEILDLVASRHSRRRPWAKLGRLFAALLPREHHCGFSSDARAIIARLLRGTTGDDGVYGHVLDRARLRELLGPEADLDEDVWRSTFCWWLYENAELLLRGEAPVAAAPVDQVPAQLPTLQLLPAPRLRRGFVAFQGYAETVRLIVEAAQGGATPDDIVEALRSTPGYDAMAPAHARRILNLVRNLGMLEHRDGLWHPSRLGERLLDDPRYDPLAEKRPCPGCC